MKGIKLGAFLFALTFFSSATGYISGVRTSQKSTSQLVGGESVAAEEIKVKSDSSEEKPLAADISGEKELTRKYVIKEHDGKLALIIQYDSGAEAIHNVYDVSVSLLPSSDREQLQSGIECDSLSEALQLAEDFSG